MRRGGNVVIGGGHGNIETRDGKKLKRNAFASGGAIAGGVDEETFIKSFEEVPRVQLYSSKELEDQLNSIRSIIQDPGNDWSKRADAVSTGRAVVLIWICLCLVRPRRNESFFVLPSFTVARS